MQTVDKLDSLSYDSIDDFIDAKLAGKSIRPTAIIGDEAFVRRIYLDLIGVTPTAGEAQAFVADKTAKTSGRS